MRRVVAAFALCAVGIVWATVPVDAYLHLTVSVRGQVTPLRWRALPVRWFAADRGAPGVSASEFQAALTSAFGVWEAVPTSAVAFQFGGFTGASPSDDDGLSTFGFEHEPDLDRTLAATSFVVDVLTGDIVESDVFFNTAFAWSTTGAANAFDLQSVATHEIGHFAGLGHSALGETELLAGGGRRVLATSAVMFPISFGRGVTADRVLQADDVAGVSELYPAGGFTSRTGTIQGRVRIGGRRVFGAHVVAFNPRTGTLVGAFSLGDDGEFHIAGLAPGAHVIRVEPLDDAGIDSFFDDTGVDASFRAMFHDRLVVAPSGGAGASIDVTVQPK